MPVTPGIRCFLVATMILWASRLLGTNISLLGWMFAGWSENGRERSWIKHPITFNISYSKRKNIETRIVTLFYSPNATLQIFAIILATIFNSIPLFLSTISWNTSANGKILSAEIELKNLFARILYQQFFLHKMLPLPWLKLSWRSRRPQQ